MTKTEIRWGWRHIAALSAGSLLLTAVVLALTVSISPQIPRKNTAEAFDLLAHARLQQGATPEVVLSDRVTLVPEREKIAVGYYLMAHLRGGSFVLEARPLQPGKTGLLYFHRDESGIVRFDAYKPAGDSSRAYVR